MSISFGSWRGSAGFILAGGPSLTGFDPSRLPADRCIVVNNAFRLLPGAALLYFCDLPWYAERRNEVRQTFQGRIATIAPIPVQYKDDDIEHYELKGRHGLSTSPGSLCHGTNAGYQSINVAFLLGADPIVLLGFDMRVWTLADAANPDNYIQPHWPTIQAVRGKLQASPARAGTLFTSHWITNPANTASGGGHGAPVHTQKRRLTEVMLPAFESIAEPLAEQGAKVINSTPNSALRCFDYQSIEQVLSLYCPPREFAIC